ncbi:protocatechuate 3,4-dioxygenase subunit beta [Acidiphilium iwatense]|uniref:Protocatechuate 3,4-dioxygenase subunit beta n=2 Tax=Acidiphilium TaxID=522 RepID=A0ABS9DZ88_9PROT|nr:MULTISPECIES: protocatechuate 3,4-dioxygenase subunit beta [Acidiphilium]MCF3948079.1 protocatechuate 3,4-dioxygenase subunit beta [Acidiphilium iwatense]
MIDTTPFRALTPDTQPPYLAPEYRSTVLRSPRSAPVAIPQTITELTGPVFTAPQFPPTDNLALTDGREALGERIIVTGRVLDEDGKPVPHSMIEIWQANAAGRYAHPGDTHDAPLDPNFRGSGRVFTDQNGAYRFVTIKPGAYPWGNHHNAWRPNHIHVSLFGPGFATRLITQMYFPGDPLLDLDPIFLATPDADARNRLIAAFDIGVTEPGRALGYHFDIVLRGRHATPMEN